MANWEENKHPRDEGGKFTSKGGASKTVGEDLTDSYANAFYKQAQGDKEKFIQHNIARFGIPRGSSRRKEEEYYGKQFDELSKKSTNEKTMRNADEKEVWSDNDIDFVVADNEYVYADIKDKEHFAKLLNERNGVPLDKAKEWVEKHFDEYTAYYNDDEEEIEIDDDYERAYGEAPDKEEFPKAYQKYVENYKKWLSNKEEQKEKKQASKLFGVEL